MSGNPDVGQRERLPVIRQTTASGDKSKIRRKRSTMTKAKTAGAEEDWLDQIETVRLLRNCAQYRLVLIKLLLELKWCNKHDGIRNR